MKDLVTSLTMDDQVILNEIKHLEDGDEGDQMAINVSLTSASGSSTTDLPVDQSLRYMEGIVAQLRTMSDHLAPFKTETEDKEPPRTVAELLSRNRKLVAYARAEADWFPGNPYRKLHDRLVAILDSLEHFNAADKKFFESLHRFSIQFARGASLASQESHLVRDAYNMLRVSELKALACFQDSMFGSRDVLLLVWFEFCHRVLDQLAGDMSSYQLLQPFFKKYTNFDLSEFPLVGETLYTLREIYESELEAEEMADLEDEDEDADEPRPTDAKAQTKLRVIDALESHQVFKLEWVVQLKTIMPRTREFRCCLNVAHPEPVAKACPRFQYVKRGLRQDRSVHGFKFLKNIWSIFTSSKATA